uniref:HEAT repeat-containing protein 1 n=1 Tax=Panagrellus redivivus TaxID=6233 RepID=A0A7E4W2G9_PANRE
MMTYLSELSITSTINHIRVNARDILLQYVTTYKLSQAKLEKWVTFYLDQLEYDYEDGRLSAVEMIHSLVTAFSEKTNDSFALLIFIKLAARVVNEESKKCTKFVILALHNLFKCTSEKAHNELFSVTKDWLEADKEGPRLIAYELFAELVRGIPGLGAQQLKVCLPILSKHFLALKIDEFSENVVLGILNAFTVLCQVQPVVFIETFVDLSKEHNLLVRLNDFLRCVLSRSVQLAASGFLGQLLASFRNEDIKAVHKKLKAIFVKEVGWIEFTYSMCFQLKGRVLTDETAEQIIKNLVFLSGQIASDEDYAGFVTRVANVCSKEVVEFSNESTRVCLFAFWHSFFIQNLFSAQSHL